EDGLDALFGEAPAVGGARVGHAVCVGEQYLARRNRFDLHAVMRPRDEPQRRPGRAEAPRDTAAAAAATATATATATDEKRRVVPCVDVMEPAVGRIEDREECRRKHVGTIV